MKLRRAVSRPAPERPIAVAIALRAVRLAAVTAAPSTIPPFTHLARRSAAWRARAEHPARGDQAYSGTRSTSIQRSCQKRRLTGKYGLASNGSGPKPASKGRVEITLACSVAAKRANSSRSVRSPDPQLRAECSENSGTNSGATENTVLGPFYVANPPRYENGHNICIDGRGEPLVIRGRVTDVSGAPIAGATVDVWQTNEDGFYDVQQKGVQPEINSATYPRQR